MQTFPIPKRRAEVLVNDFVRSVYNWMCIGLALTAVVALYVSSNDALFNLIFRNRLLFFGLILGELALVFSISGMVNRIKAGTASALFVLYSALNGATLSMIFRIYTSESIASTFFICSATFLACSIYGWVTKRDLTSLGGFLTMGLIGIIIASFANMFFLSSAVSRIVSYIGVIVFVGLSAYDTQKLKNMALTQPADLDREIVRKGAILGALSLYLDFINLFLMFLRIFGSSRD